MQKKLILPGLLPAAGDGSAAEFFVAPTGNDGFTSGSLYVKTPYRDGWSL